MFFALAYKNQIFPYLCLSKAINTVLNPYSVLTPPGGVLGFLKITHFTDIFLFIACKIRKHLIFIQKTRNMSDAVRVKHKAIIINRVIFSNPML